MTPPNIIVIGAGAAGMIAAGEAAARGARVKLLEKNGKTGVKILMSGGTRCNITQNTDAKGITRAFGKSGRFLQKSVGAFGPSDVVAMFHSCGVATKVESTGKVFPTSDRALDVRNALQRRAIEHGVEILLRTSVDAVQNDAGVWNVQTNQGTFTCDRLIVTAGGKSWPGCGTTGDAYGWLQKLGHTVVPPRPALVPLVGGTAWTHALSGLTLDNCTASVFARGGRKRKPLVQRSSSFLFTHFGFSGPAAMDVSGTLTAAESFRDVVLRVDLLPDVSPTSLESALSDRGGGGRRAVKSVLSPWLPNRLVDALVQQTETAQTTLAELPRAKLQKLVEALKRWEVPVSGTRGFQKAEVTAGGITLAEVDPATMASRLVPNLFIAGEVLDVDGWIGGYNFQAAFSTGRAAGIAASRE